MRGPSEFAGQRRCWDALPRHDVNVEQMIEAAERGGRIAALTHWVMNRVLADIAGPVADLDDFKLWINLSAVLLIDDTYISALISRIGPVHSRIGLEITETAVIADPDRAIANLQRIADAGIEVAIDDYGTGVSSLAYLKQMPVTEMKIDRAFVADLTTSHRDPLIIRSTIDLAHALDMRVTAEGVDNPISQALLTVMGCDYLQGHHIGKPMPIMDILPLVRQQNDPAKSMEITADDILSAENPRKTGLTSH
jgi:diguanylate cyclase